MAVIIRKPKKIHSWSTSGQELLRIDNFEMTILYIIITYTYCAKFGLHAMNNTYESIRFYI